MMKRLFYFLFVTLWSTSLLAQKVTAEKEPNSGKYGFKKGGEWILPPKYGFASWQEDDNIGMVWENHGEYNGAVVNQYGKIITDFEYNGVTTSFSKHVEFMSDLITVFKGDEPMLWGVINRKGDVVVPCKYTTIQGESNEHHSGFIVRTTDDKWGLLYEDGKTWIDAKYSNYLLVPSTNNYIIVNTGGKIVTTGEGAYTTGGKWGVVDIQGKELVPCIYDSVEDGSMIQSESNDSLLFAVNRGGTRGKLGNCTGGKWGLFLNGKEVVACQYDEAPNFCYENQTIDLHIDGSPVSLRNPLSRVGSDVDENIPIVKEQNPSMFAVIIGNEKYADETDVPFAENDAIIFKEYCNKTLGVQENHIKYITNAGYNDLRKAVSWLRQGMEAYGGDGRAVIYYAGHGIPDEASKSAYLLPTDGIGSDVGTAYSLEKLYQALSEMPAKSITVFLDACFSGAKRDGGMMTSARGVAIKAKAEEPKGNVIVFSASQGDETAYPYKSQQHGMFTYFLLHKLQETNGKATLGEIANYIIRQVKRQSFDENNRSQTPTIITATGLKDSWRSMRIK